MGNAVFDQFLQLLSDYKDKDPVVALSTHFGDVTCHPGLAGIIRKIGAIDGVSGISFFTNAILLDKHNLAGLPIHHVDISTSIGEVQYKALFGVDQYNLVMTNILIFLSQETIPVKVLLRVDKPFRLIKKHPDYKHLTKWIRKKNIKFLEEWDDFQGVVVQSDLPVGASFRLPPPKGKICRHLSRRLLVWRDGEVGVGCRPHQEFIVGNVFDYLPLQHMVYGPVQNIRRDWEDGKYPAPCVDCISYQPNRVSLRYRIKSNYKKAKAIILRRAFI